MAPDSWLKLYVMTTVKIQHAVEPTPMAVPRTLRAAGAIGWRGAIEAVGVTKVPCANEGPNVMHAHTWTGTPFRT
jgi:hypothetical protein